VLDAKTGKPIGGAAPYVLRDAGPLKVGFIGLCLKTPLNNANQAGIRFTDPLLAAARYIPILKRRGANVIVAITHLGFDEDRALVRRFPEIDLVVGGHEHYPITASENHALVSKAGSEAKWAARIDINRTSTGTIERFYELIPVTSAIADDPQTAQVVASYEARLGNELDQVVGTSTVGLDATGLREISESNLGNLVADALRADVGADIGLTNAGAIRGDRLYPAGPLTRRTLIAMHPFGNVNCEIAITGRVLLAALNNGVSKLPMGAGQFPQVSGVSLKVNPRAPPGNRVTGVMVNGQPLDPDKTYTLALPDYVLKGGDNYTMFANARVLVGPESGNLIVAALEKYIAAKRIVSPGTEGRITTE
jgi:2',3'-cyclic-nucleotide 2'-phosphodiesterase (5'-nucleotidase family)